VQVFSDYGYEPKKGAAVKAGAQVTGSKGNRVYYKRPAADVAPVGAWGVMTYTVADLSPSNEVMSTSYPGMVTFVPPSGILVGSQFGRGAEGWAIVGNQAASSEAKWEPSSRGALNYYVYGSDDIINTVGGGGDASRWYFDAPAKFLGHHGIAYGGTLDFTLSSFQGDFSAGQLNPGEGSTGLHLVELYCAQCRVNRGATLVFPLSRAQAFTGATTSYSLNLSEAAGWLEDPRNTLASWVAPSQCAMVEVLSGLSAVRILGDFTRWYESVALDNAHFVNLKAQVPVCAQETPDASRCSCNADAYPNKVLAN
jgi:hypothetical protein